MSPPRIRQSPPWLLAAFACAIAARAAADEPPAGPVVRLKPKSVVAPKPLLATDPTGDGAPIATVDGARMRQGSRTVAEAVADLPGAHALQVGGPGSAAQVTVRGGTTDQVAVYLGDSPLPNWDGAAFDLADLPLFALDRLELYRGAPTAELGGQPIGGALRLVPRSARSREVELRADAGSFGSNGIEAGYSHRDRRWRVFSGARWQRSRGNFDYALDPGTAFDPSDDRSAVRTNNEAQRLSGLVHADLRLSSGATVAATWLGASLDQGLAGPALLQAQSARFERQRQVGVVAGRLADVVAVGDNVTWSVAGSWLDSAVSDPFGELGPARDDGTRTAGAMGTAAWTSPATAVAGGEATLLTRAEGGAADVAVRDRRASGGSPVSMRTVGGVQAALRWVGAAGALQATPAAGVQVARSSVEGTVLEGAAATLPWHAGLAVRFSPSSTWSLSAGARRATRLPNLQELFADTGAVSGNLTLRPETALSADLGATAQGAQAGWQWAADMRAFATGANDLIQLVQVGPHRARYFNIATADLWGGEATLRAAMGSTWQATLQHATLLGRDRSQRDLYHGRALPLRPRSKWLAECRWSPALPGPLATELWAAWRWQSGYWLDAANEVALPARGLWSAGLQATTRDNVAAVALRVDNVLHARNFDLVGWPLPGRTVWLTVTWHFAAGKT